MKVLSAISLACLLVATIAAPLEERFIPHLMHNDEAAATATNAEVDASVAAAVNADPVVVSHGSAGKKIQITITKEITKAGGGGHQTGHGGAGAQATGHANAHAHAGHAANNQLPTQLHIDNNALVVDNETMADVLQQLLAGNIQNVQAHGRPLVIPPGGKPVAVIFSSSMHVVDLGNLQAPAAAPAAAHAHGGVAHGAAAHGAGHNQTAAAHTGHNFNHTSLIESIMSPLMALTHMGHNANAAQVVAASPVIQQAAPMMQPVVLMMPVSQSVSQGVASSMQLGDSSAQLTEILQNILNAKQQMLGSQHHAGHANVSSPVQVSAAPANVSAQAEASAQVVATPVVAEAAVAAAAEVPVLSVARPTKVKKFDFHITKTV